MGVSFVTLAVKIRPASGRWWAWLVSALLAITGLAHLGGAVRLVAPGFLPEVPIDLGVLRAGLGPLSAALLAGVALAFPLGSPSRRRPPSAGSGLTLRLAIDAARVARDHADRAGALKTSFLRMVSHELRTPLTAIELYLDRLDRAGRATTSDEVVRRLRGSVERLHELVETLLESARIQSGRLSVEVRPFDLQALVREVTDEVLPQAVQKGLELRMEARAGAFPELHSDPRFVRLIVANLVRNAVRFTATGMVTVSILEEDRAYRIVVADSGPGIPAEDRERIFEPFEQMEPIHKKHAPGVGLGLAIVRDLATALGGRVELVSEVGAGSTFTLVLPDSSSSRALAASKHRAVSSAP